MSRRVPTLETERLRIREFARDDLESINSVLNAAYEDHVSLEDRGKWLEWTVLGYEMFAMLDQPPYGDRAIVERDGGQIVGAVGIVPYIDTFANVSALALSADSGATAQVGMFWAIDPSRQRKGYAAEAATAVMDYLFCHESLGRIIATTGPDNAASQRVMQKLGMTVQSFEDSQGPGTLVVGVKANPDRW